MAPAALGGASGRGEDYDDLLEKLQAFTTQSREALVGVLLESVPRLAESWRRAQPQGQEAVTA